MRKLKKLLFLFMISFSFSLLFSFAARAEDGVEFRVETTESSPDGKIEVNIYIDDIENIGGADLELQYDPEQVICVDSGLGESVSCAYYDVYHNQEKNLVKYVLLLPSIQDTGEPFLKATFNLLDAESYEPVFHVVDLVDDTDEIADVDCKILYQQADGTWTEAGESTEEQEESAVISDTPTESTEEKPEETGTQNKVENTETTDRTVTADVETLPEQDIDSQEDSEILNNTETTVDSKASESSVSAESTDVKKDIQEEAEEPDMEPEAEENIGSEKKSGINAGIFLMFLIVLVVAFILWRQWKKKR